MHMHCWIFTHYSRGQESIINGIPYDPDPDFFFSGKNVEKEQTVPVIIRIRSTGSWLIKWCVVLFYFFIFSDVAIKVGCFKTERDAIRIIGAGGFYINQQRCSNTEEVILHGVHILPNNLMLVRVGKKNYYIVEWTWFLVIFQIKYRYTCAGI
jgi:hypothetical protein